MRHLILALMIALLPIRGWVGDVMATEMASRHPAQVASASPAAIESIADHAHGAGAERLFEHESAMPQQLAAMPDCADHGDSPAPAGAHCESCATCQACHTVALTPVTAGMDAIPVSTAQLYPAAARFTSALAAPGQKPPIS